MVVWTSTSEEVEVGGGLYWWFWEQIWGRGGWWWFGQLDLVKGRPLVCGGVVWVRGSNEREIGGKQI